MAIKLILLSLLIVGCGREVKIPNKLATASQLSENDLKKFQKSGSLIKGDPDQIQYNGMMYKVSIYSSHSSQEFIKSIRPGSRFLLFSQVGLIRANL
jgi:hypothetical protein